MPRVARGLGVMGDHDNCLAVFAIEQFEQIENLVGGLAVEIAGGLVANQYARVGDDGPGDGDALLLPAGEFAGFVAGAVGQTDDGQGDIGMRLALPAATGSAARGNSTFLRALKMAASYRTER